MMSYQSWPPSDRRSSENKRLKIALALLAAAAVVLSGMFTGLIPQLLSGGGNPPPPPSETVQDVPTPASSTGPTPHETVPPPRPTTVVTPLPDVVVPGRLANGVQYTAEQAGTYRFQYKGGAYSVFPEGQSGPNGRPYRTAIFAFRGDRALFDDEVIAKDRADLIIADTTDTASELDAVTMASGTSWVEIELSAGEVITLAAVDHLYSYGDNPGSVTLTVSYVTRAAA